MNERENKSRKLSRPAGAKTGQESTTKEVSEVAFECRNAKTRRKISQHVVGALASCLFAGIGLAVV